jgi:hypothetical protein
VKCSEGGKSGRATDRQDRTDGQTDRTDRQTGGQTDRQTDGWTDRRVEGITGVFSRLPVDIASKRRDVI